MRNKDLQSEKTEQTVKCLARYVNSSNFSKDSAENFANILTTAEHRTLQQLIFKCFAACILKWAECATTNCFDGRNEHTVKTCKKIVDAIGEDALKYMPYI